MPSAAALQSAYTRDRAVRHDAYAKRVRINGTEGKGTYNDPRFTGPQTEGGFKSDSDVILRLQKADWPSLRSAIEVAKAKVELPTGPNGAWLTFRVDANAPVIDAHRSGEWILHLDYLHSVL